MSVAEQWRPIPGFPGYEVNEHGQILSRMLKRPIVMSTSLSAGYPGAVLRQNGRRRMMRAHVAVALAFIGPRPEGADIRHLDGNPLNNHVSNLQYGSRAENMQDAIRHGRQLGTGKQSHCGRGHSLSGENLRVTHGKRQCRGCLRENMRAYRERHGLQGKGPKAQCVRGHAFEGRNLRISPSGARECRACGAIRQREVRERRMMRAADVPLSEAMERYRTRDAED